MLPEKKTVFSGECEVHEIITYILVLENLMFMEKCNQLMAVLYSVDALMAYNGGALEVTGPNATAHIFATYPSPFLSLASGFADQVSALAGLILRIKHTENCKTKQ